MTPSEVLRRARTIYQPYSESDPSGTWGQWAIAQVTGTESASGQFEKLSSIYRRAGYDFDRAIALAEAEE